VEALSVIAEECRAKGESFPGLMMERLGRVLGYSAANALMHYVDGLSPADPSRIVTELESILKGGSEVILRVLVSTDSR
jgi:hypothetical protein